MQTIDIPITAAMLAEADAKRLALRIARTRTSEIDTLTGAVGELAFAQWFLGDWQAFRLARSAGREDFGNRIEVKASTFPFSPRLNLLVREDYAEARRPQAYVQVIIDAPTREARAILPGWKARIAGWASAEDLDKALLRNMGAKAGRSSDYRCRALPLAQLRPMASFPVPRPL